MSIKGPLRIGAAPLRAPAARAASGGRSADLPCIAPSRPGRGGRPAFLVPAAEAAAVAEADVSVRWRSCRARLRRCREAAPDLRSRPVFRHRFESTGRSGRPPGTRPRTPCSAPAAPWCPPPCRFSPPPPQPPHPARRPARPPTPRRRSACACTRSWRRPRAALQGCALGGMKRGLPPPAATPAPAPAALLPRAGGGSGTSSGSGKAPLSPRVLAARRPPGIGAAGVRAAYPAPAAHGGEAGGSDRWAKLRAVHMRRHRLGSGIPMAYRPACWRPPPRPSFPAAAASAASASAKAARRRRIRRSDSRPDARLASDRHASEQ